MQLCRCLREDDVGLQEVKSSKRTGAGSNMLSRRTGFGGAPVWWIGMDDRWAESFWYIAGGVWRS